jgi:ribosome maturation factor RimP
MKLSSTEQKIYDVLEPVAKGLGYEIVKISLVGSNRKVLDIAIDRLDGQGVTIANCRNASNNFSAILDVEEIIPDRYYLEVGSAGVERPLVRIEDFSRFAGKKITLKLHNLFNDSKKMQCDLLGLEDNKIKIKLKNGDIALFDYDEIKGANLVFTDEMFRESLKKEKIDK